MLPSAARRGAATMVRAAVAAAALALVLVPSTAHAATGTGQPIPPLAGQVATGDGTLYAGCATHEYGYAITTTEPDWELEVSLVGPDGTPQASDYLHGTDRSESGTRGFRFCGQEQPGTWTIQATLREYDDSEPTAEVQLAPATFEMHRPLTDVTLSASRVRGGATALRVRVRTETRDGWAAADYLGLQLQRRTASGWHSLAGPEVLTDDRGVARATYRFHGRTKVRAVAEPAGYAAGQDTVTVRR